MFTVDMNPMVFLYFCGPPCSCSSTFPGPIVCFLLPLRALPLPFCYLPLPLPQSTSARRRRPSLSLCSCALGLCSSAALPAAFPSPTLPSPTRAVYDWRLHRLLCLCPCTLRSKRTNAQKRFKAKQKPQNSGANEKLNFRAGPELKIRPGPKPIFQGRD